MNDKTAQKLKNLTLTILMLVAMLLVFAACNKQASNVDELKQTLEPSGVALLVQALNNAVGNYGWTMVLFTVILKVIVFPVELWQKVAAKKSALQQKEMAPMKDAIEKKYGANTQRSQEELQKLYKKQGFSALSMCLPTIVTMLIFIFMFTGVNNYSRYRNFTDYMALSDKYDEYIAAGDTVDEAKDKLFDFYTDEVQEKWLWIKTVWRPDTWDKIMADYSSFASSVGLSTSGGGSSVGDMAQKYDIIYDAIVTKGYDGWNGFMILPLLCVALSFLSMWLPQQLDKKQGITAQNMDAQSAATNKTMMFMMPAMMAFFGFVYTGAFAIYITCNYALNLITTLAMRAPVDKIAAKSLAKRENVEEKASYKR